MFVLIIFGDLADYVITRKLKHLGTKVKWISESYFLSVSKKPKIVAILKTEAMVTAGWVVIHALVLLLIALVA